MEYCLYKPVSFRIQRLSVHWLVSGWFLKCPTVLIVSLIWAEESMRLMLTENFRGRIGIYHTDAERMFHYYVRPQATGNRTDVRWMQVSDELEKGLSVWGRSHLNLVYLLSLMRI